MIHHRNCKCIKVGGAMQAVGEKQYADTARKGEERDQTLWIRGGLERRASE